MSYSPKNGDDVRCSAMRVNGVNIKRVRRLMRVMGLEEIYPKPRLSANAPDHKVYPDLLKGVVVDRPDQG